MFIARRGTGTAPRGRLPVFLCAASVRHWARPLRDKFLLYRDKYRATRAAAGAWVAQDRPDLPASRARHPPAPGIRDRTAKYRRRSDRRLRGSTTPEVAG